MYAGHSPPADSCERRHNREPAAEFRQNCRRIERAKLRLKRVRLEPHRMPVGLARLRSARLPHVSMRSTAKGHEFANVKTHSVCDAHDHLEVSLRVRNFTRFLHQLQVAAGVRESS